MEDQKSNSNKKKDRRASFTIRRKSSSGQSPTLRRRSGTGGSGSGRNGKTLSRTALESYSPGASPKPKGSRLSRSQRKAVPIGELESFQNSGYLGKHSGKKWQKRFFVCDGKRLVYFATEMDAMLQSSMGKEIVVTECVVEPFDPENRPDSFGICLTTPVGSVMKLEAYSVEDQEKWIRVIQKCSWSHLVSDSDPVISMTRAELLVVEKEAIVIQRFVRKWLREGAGSSSRERSGSTADVLNWEAPVETPNNKNKRNSTSVVSKMRNATMKLTRRRSSKTVPLDFGNVEESNFHSGYLWRKSSAKSRYRKRYFVTSGIRLLYYKNETEGMLQQDVGQEICVTECVVEPCKDQAGETGFGIKISAPEDGRIVALLEAFNPEDQAAWIQAILKCTWAHLVDHNRKKTSIDDGEPELEPHTQKINQAMSQWRTVKEMSERASGGNLALPPVDEEMDIFTNLFSEIRSLRRKDIPEEEKRVKNLVEIEWDASESYCQMICRNESSHAASLKSLVEACSDGSCPNKTVVLLEDPLSRLQAAHTSFMNTIKKTSSVTKQALSHHFKQLLEIYPDFLDRWYAALPFIDEPDQAMLEWLTNLKENGVEMSDLLKTIPDRPTYYTSFITKLEEAGVEDLGPVTKLLSDLEEVCHSAANSSEVFYY